MKTKYDFSAVDSLIRFVRLSKGMTQHDLARLCNLTANDISRMERGWCGMSVYKMHRVADQLGLTVHELVFNDFATALPKLPRAVHNPRINQLRRHRYAQQITTGDQGEAYVVELERERLKDTPYAEAVNGSFADDPLSGFDIQSFTEEGTPVYIEVKSTVGEEDAPFYMSAAEEAFLLYCVDNKLTYRLYRVSHIFKRHTPMVSVYSAEDLLELFDFTLDTYIVSRKESA